MYLIVLGFLTQYTFMYNNYILHYVLFLDNILFHKIGDHMNIGICDWGYASRVGFLHMSKYNYGTVEELNKNNAKGLWIDCTLFTIYGQEKVKHSLGT
jgi:hypothetical protein